MRLQTGNSWTKEQELATSPFKRERMQQEQISFGLLMKTAQIQSKCFSQCSSIDQRSRRLSTLFKYSGLCPCSIRSGSSFDHFFFSHHVKVGEPTRQKREDQNAVWDSFPSADFSYRNNRDTSVSESMCAAESLAHICVTSSEFM